MQTPWWPDVILSLTHLIEIVFLAVTWNTGSMYHNKEGVLLSPLLIFDHLDKSRCLHVPVVQHLTENVKLLILCILQNFYFFTNHEDRSPFPELLKRAIAAFLAYLLFIFNAPRLHFAGHVVLYVKQRFSIISWIFNTTLLERNPFS